MQLTTSIYQYNIEALTQSGQLDQMISAAFIILGVAAIFILPKLYILLDIRTAAKNKIKKRAAIGDLIAMKEIQTEIEKEMREALIRSELRSKEVPGP